jgi:hypothetical protein
VDSADGFWGPNLISRRLNKGRRRRGWLSANLRWNHDFFDDELEGITVFGREEANFE